MIRKSLYYKATIKPENALLFTSLLQSLDDNYVFFRGIAGTRDQYEFFVPADCKSIFLKNIKILISMNLVDEFTEES